MSGIAVAGAASINHIGCELDNASIARQTDNRLASFITRGRRLTAVLLSQSRAQHREGREL
jgi:hypothetical protein